MGGVIVEPREVRRTIVHERLKGVNQHREGRLFQLPTCLTQRQTPLHPGIALDTRRTQGTLAPQQGAAHSVSSDDTTAHTMPAIAPHLAAQDTVKSSLRSIAKSLLQPSVGTFGKPFRIWRRVRRIAARRRHGEEPSLGACRVGRRHVGLSGAAGVQVIGVRCKAGGSRAFSTRRARGVRAAAR